MKEEGVIYECGQCEKKYERRDVLRRHVRLVHEGNFGSPVHQNDLGLQETMRFIFCDCIAETDALEKSKSK